MKGKTQDSPVRVEQELGILTAKPLTLSEGRDMLEEIMVSTRKVFIVKQLMYTVCIKLSFQYIGQNSYYFSYLETPGISYLVRFPE